MVIWDDSVIQRPEIGQQLTKVTGLRQRSIAPTLAPEIQPVIIVANIEGTLSASPTIRQCVFANRQGGVAGNFAAFSVENPANSGILVLIRKVIVNGGAADIQLFAAQPPSPPPGAGITDQFLDRRLVRVTGLEQPQAVTRMGAVAASPGGSLVGYFFKEVSDGDHIWEPPLNSPLILAETQFFYVISSVVNVSISANIFWDELEDTEAK